MKTYEEMTRSVLKRVHENEAAQKKRRTVVLRTAVPVCTAAAVVGTISFAQFNNKIPTESGFIAGGAGDNIMPGGNTIGATMDESGNISYIYENSATDEPETSQSVNIDVGDSNSHSTASRDIEFNSAPDDLKKVVCLPMINNEEKLSPEEASKYYGIDILAMEKYFPTCTAKYEELVLKKNDDRLVYDGNFVEYEFSDSSDTILALFRKQSKWKPAEKYETEDFAGTEVTFFKDGGEIRAVFEVSETQITLQSNDMKNVLTAIKVFINENEMNANPVVNELDGPVLTYN